ncbi:TPA: hypothetical protein RQJ89_000991 [Vibrio vulnificus]|nr:hypothetical protein [Vibrio vulnificus]HDY7663853.1 hypothetical protein [Vibrio vulnificus]HDY7667693.1 hypothetical protein [Vibrio vulnificus]
MLSFYERDVDFLEINISSIPANLPVQFSLVDHIIPALENGVTNRTNVYSFKSGSASIQLEKVKVSADKKFCTMLFHYTDKNVSDPAFKSLRTGVVRKAEKNKDEDEGIAISAHLVIALDKPFKQHQPNYFALLEVVPGLTKTLLERAMRSFFAHEGAATWTHPNEQKQVRPSFTLSNLTSRSLSEGLIGRRLTALTFIHKDLQDDMDENELRATEQRISYAVGRSITEEAAVKLLRSASQKAKNKGYSVLTVKYEDVYGSTKSGTFKSLDQEVLEKAAGVFAKRAKLRSDIQIDQCNEQIHHDLSAKMIDLLGKEGGLQDATNYQETLEAVEVLTN